MNVSSQKTGSEVNGLEQPFHPLQGLLLPIARLRWLGKSWRREMIMRLLSDGSLPSEGQRIFILVE